jgi:hypothetical protein
VALTLSVMACSAKGSLCARPYTKTGMKAKTRCARRLAGGGCGIGAAVAEAEMIAAERVGLAWLFVERVIRGPNNLRQPMSSDCARPPLCTSARPRESLLGWGCLHRTTLEHAHWLICWGKLRVSDVDVMRRGVQPREGQR